MFNFIRNWFRSFFNFMIWICFIFFTIAGLAAGSKWGDGAGYLILGGILGFLIALVINVIGGGIIATFLNIDDNLEEIKNLLKNSGGKVEINPPLK